MEPFHRSAYRLKQRAACDDVGPFLASGIFEAHDARTTRHGNKVANVSEPLYVVIGVPALHPHLSNVKRLLLGCNLSAAKNRTTL
jgi:hypothetical protein